MRKILSLNWQKGTETAETSPMRLTMDIGYVVAFCVNIDPPIATPLYCSIAQCPIAKKDVRNKSTVIYKLQPVGWPFLQFSALARFSSGQQK